MVQNPLPSRGAHWARKGAIRPLLIRALAPVALYAAAASFEIPPVTASVTAAGQTIPVPSSGAIAQSAQCAFDFNLRAGMAGLQDHITPILQSLLNKSDGCGERLSIQNAILTPAPTAAQLTIQFHFEKFDCVKLLGKEALGKQSSKRLLGGNDTALLLITPVVEQTNAVRLSADVGRLSLETRGRLAIPLAKVASLTGQLRGRQ